LFVVVTIDAITYMYS